MFPQTGYDYRYQPGTAAMPTYEVGQPGAPLPRPLEPSAVYPSWTPQLDPRSSAVTRNGLSSQSRFDSDRDSHRKQLPSIRDLMTPPPASRTPSSPQWTEASHAYGASSYPSRSASTVSHPPSDNREPHYAQNFDVNYGSQYLGRQQYDLAARPVAGPTSSRPNHRLNIAASPQGLCLDRFSGPPYLQRRPARLNSSFGHKHRPTALLSILAHPWTLGLGSLWRREADQAWDRQGHCQVDPLMSMNNTLKEKAGFMRTKMAAIAKWRLTVKRSTRPGA